MNAHALGILELDRALAVVAERAASALGAERIRELRPTVEREWLAAELGRVAAVRAILGGELGWAPEALPDIRAALRRLRVEGASWSGQELLDAGRLLRSSRRTVETLRDPRRPAVVAAVLGPLISRLFESQELERAIGGVIDDDATVRDDASPMLRRVRRELRGAHGELVKLLERIMRRLEPHQAVSDMSVTVRNGRYVIPVRREARGEIGGIVHDSSGTGATLFVEPPAAVEFGNRIRELESEELREVERILAELTLRLRPHREALADTLDALVELDSLYGRARFGREFECGAVELCRPHDGFDIRRGRHPLLVAQGVPVVSFDLAMLADERTLLVSGPNTGGKTVLLKAIGLISALTQSGVPAPVAEGSRIALFDDFFADVGDEQSIQASLSTFSAHIKNLAEILEASTSASLVLVDELGSGTDPMEGAALGGAILEELTRRRTTTIATTHLGALKELATEVPGVVNASLQFDSVALAPTYRLIKGIPGRSYGLSIARRLALPERVLVRAEERVPQTERDVEALLADLERRDKILADQEREVAQREADATQRAARLGERERAVRLREREVERQARQEARQYVLQARQEIERTIKSLRNAGAGAMEDAAREARQRAEQLIGKQNDQLDRLDREARNADRHATRDAARDAGPPGSGARPLREGDHVAVASLGGKPGRVLALRDGTATVVVGAVKLQVPTDSLRRVAAPSAPAETVVLRGDQPELEVASEVDLRGLRYHELDELLMHALDAAVRADLKTLRIIHGKGTGALRGRVDEMLRKDTRVREHRLGAWNEGGTGVTVVEFA
ncbi:MAG: endonuclease MutS2 [Gemmatimonadaceae bacterium]